MDAYDQIKAKSLGLSIKGLTLLMHIRDNFIPEIVKGSTLQKQNCLIFTSANDVKKGATELKEAGLIDCSYENGQIKDLNVDIVECNKFFSEKLNKIKRESVKKVAKKTEKTSPETKDIIDYYNSFPLLPRPAGLTDTAKRVVGVAMGDHSVDSIKDGILHASKANWLINKADENWCNMVWVIRNIDRFVEGGKYRDKIQKSENNVVQSEEEEIVI